MKATNIKRGKDADSIPTGTVSPNPIINKQEYVAAEVS
jgi:hypothetical protein